MPKVKGHTTHVGYRWKLCPYSTAYATIFYNRGYRGYTNNSDITDLNFTSVITADHLFTEGTLVYHNPGGNPGWLCRDDDCPYFIDNGVRYFEL